MTHSSFIRFICLCWLVHSNVVAFQPVRTPKRDCEPMSASCLHSFSSIGEPITDRRTALLQWSGLALSTLILGQPANAAVDPKTILITGSNSGIGFEAAKFLSEQGHTLILACRTLEKSMDAIQRIESQATAPLTGKLFPSECNLASLQSIKSCVQDLSVPNLDVVCYNAGLSLNVDDKKIQRTVDGFELTVGTNHLGHFYLNHLLLPKIEPSNGRIVVTASGVHDPESPGGGVGVPAGLGNLDGLERDGKNFEMVDGSSYDGDKAYKDSKLCNVLFTRELQRRLEASDSTKRIIANCFNPGLITSTGFFRNQNPVFSKVFGAIVSNVAKVAETPEWGGHSLAYMTTVNSSGEYYASPPGSSKYGDDAFGNQFTVSPISKEAKDDAKAKKLWTLSEQLVGIST